MVTMLLLLACATPPPDPHCETDPVVCELADHKAFDETMRERGIETPEPAP